MSSQGPLSPSTIVSDASGGGTAWATPSNAGASDDAYAACTFSGVAFSEFLKATQFGLSIPTGATIVGIIVDVERSRSGPNNVTTITAQLVKAGAYVGSNYGDSGVNWPTSDAYVSYGGATDLWGTTWTPAEINATDFGVILTAFGNNNTGNVDHMRITVSYTEVSPGPGIRVFIQP